MKIIKALVLCVCVSGFAQATIAMPIVQTAACVNDADATCATGVNGVDILGTLYDVMFSQAAYNSLFTTALPTFLNNLFGADAAVAALITPLNSAEIEGLLGNPTSSFNYLLVPFEKHPIYQYNNNKSASYSVGNVTFSPSGSYVTSADTPLSISTPRYYDAYAVFTPSSTAIPAPSVLILFGLGLAGIHLSRPKRSFPLGTS